MSKSAKEVKEELQIRGKLAITSRAQRASGEHACEAIGRIHMAPAPKGVALGTRPTAASTPKSIWRLRPSGRVAPRRREMKLERDEKKRMPVSRPIPL